MNQNMMKSEKSKWFYSKFREDTKAIVILAHGLNLLPSKMDELALYLASKKCDVLRISLGSDPEKWTTKFSDYYDEALEQSEILERPLYFLGYSLGALLGVDFIVNHPQHKITKCALIAPATHTKLMTKLLSVGGILFPKLSIPSFNLEKYRQQPRTILLSYKIINHLQKKLKKLFNEKSISIPTLLVTSKDDELINSSRLTKLAALYPNWATLELTNKRSQLPIKYHHLMIDSESLGRDEWEKLLKILTIHFAL